MASFAGASFLEATTGDSYATWGSSFLFAIKQLPASNTPVVQQIGADVQRATLAILVTRTELVALYDQVLESGSLIMDWETNNAFLESVGAVARVGFEDLYQTSLNLIRL